MDDFGENDAAAEFLAREKETLGDLETEINADNGKCFWLLNISFLSVLCSDFQPI